MVNVELGADYSFARPGGAVLKAAGVVAVGRYLGVPRDGRQIEKPEYDDLTGHGIGVWFVREGAASGMLGGFSRGVSDANISVANLDRLGVTGCVVYAAADWDVQPAQFVACDDYMRGFASVLGKARTGIYGGLRYLNHCHTEGLAVAFWQAGATSWNHRETPLMPINLEQTTRTPPAPGTDHNFIYNRAALAGSAPVTVQEGDDEMLSFITRNDQSGPWFATDGLTKRFIASQADAQVLVDMGRAKWSGKGPDGKAPEQVSQAFIDSIPDVVSDVVNAIHGIVAQPIVRDGVNISQASELMNTGTLVRQIVTAGVPVDPASVAAAFTTLPSAPATRQDVTEVIGSLKLAATA